METIFETQEKWAEFLALINQKDSIVKQWYQALHEKANNYFSKIDIVNGWSFRSNVHYSIALQWFLTSLGEESISLVFGKYGQIALYYNREHNINEIAKHIKTEKFLPLSKHINYVTMNPYSIKAIGMGSGIYILNNSYLEEDNSESFAWRAGNETEKVLDDIAEKVNIFRKDKHLTQLLLELNQITRNNKSRP